MKKLENEIKFQLVCEKETPDTETRRVTLTLTPQARNLINYFAVGEEPLVDGRYRIKRYVIDYASNRFPSSLATKVLHTFWSDKESSLFEFEINNYADAINFANNLKMFFKYLADKQSEALSSFDFNVTIIQEYRIVDEEAVENKEVLDV